MKKLTVTSIAFFNLFAINTAIAYEVATEFSADAVQKAPARAEYKARMYVSKNAVRTDSMINTTPVTEIINTAKHTRVLIVPKEKVYLQQPYQDSRTGSTNDKSAKKPCTGLPDTTCKLLGKEKVNNRQTEKWEFVINRNGQIFRSLHWIDVKRKMPVREFFPDGTVTELILKGTEKMNGRQTEKWSMQTTRADGQQLSSLQWYDPELKISIREEMPGGFVRELRNIKTAKQDKKLFAIPAGYKKVQQLPVYLLPPPPATQMVNPAGPKPANRPMGQ